MRWEYIGTGIGIIAIGVTLIVAVPPPWWPKMPPQLIQLSIIVGLVLFAIGAGITGIGTWPGIPAPKGPVSLLVAAVTPPNATQFATRRTEPQLTIILLPPVKGYEFIWDPRHDLQPLLFLEQPPGMTREGAVPTFRVKNVGKDVVVPLTIEWVINEIMDPDTAVKSPHLRNYDVVITEDHFAALKGQTNTGLLDALLKTAIQRKDFVPGTNGYGMAYARRDIQELPYLAPQIDNTTSVDIRVPYKIVNLLYVFLLASVPEDGPDAYTKQITVPIFATIKWKEPAGGKPLRYRIDATAHSSKPWVGGAAHFAVEPPEIQASLTFSVTAIDQF